MKTCQYILEEIMSSELVSYTELGIYVSRQIMLGLDTVTMKCVLSGGFMIHSGTQIKTCIVKCLVTLQKHYY